MGFHEYPNTFVGQVHLYVEDVNRSLNFYQEIIGLQILEQTEFKAVLTANGKTPLVTIEQPNIMVEKKPRRTGLYHFALLLPSRADLAQVLVHLVQSGYPLQGASDHDVSEALYLGDPDGNGIEIYWDRPSESWKWEDNKVYMSTEAMDAEGVLAESNGEAWNGLPSETVMGHIHLHVSELQKTEQFYTQGLGFKVVLNYGQQALFISTGGYHHHIGLNTWNGVGAPAPEANSPGMKWFSLILPSIEERVNTIARLQKIGAIVKEENGIAITTDPSGNTIHLLV